MLTSFVRLLCQETSRLIWAGACTMEILCEPGAATCSFEAVQGWAEHLWVRFSRRFPRFRLPCKQEDKAPRARFLGRVFGVSQPAGDSPWSWHLNLQFDGSLCPTSFEMTAMGVSIDRRWPSWEVGVHL